MSATKNVNKAFHCRECGEPLINTASGKYSACPSGCGRLKPKLPPSVARVNAARVCVGAKLTSSLPNGNYRLHGLDGEWERTGRAISALVTGRPRLPGGCVIGIVGDRVYRFTPVAAAASP